MPQLVKIWTCAGRGSPFRSAAFGAAPLGVCGVSSSARFGAATCQPRARDQRYLCHSAGTSAAVLSSKGSCCAAQAAAGGSSVRRTCFKGEQTWNAVLGKPTRRIETDVIITSSYCTEAKMMAILPRREGGCLTCTEKERSSLNTASSLTLSSGQPHRVSGPPNYTCSAAGS